MEKFVYPLHIFFFSQTPPPPHILRTPTTHLNFWGDSPPTYYFPPPLLNISLTWFHKNGHISANNGPILKIRNLACSVLRCCSSGRQNYVARDVMRARTSHARGRCLGRHKAKQSLNLNLVAVPVAMGLSHKTQGGFSLFFTCKLIQMGRPYLAKINRIGSVCVILESFS